MRSVLDDFKAFVMRGNVLDLAVAVILGAAFGTVVSAFTDGVLMAFIAAIFGKPNFNALTWTVGDGVVRYGTFITAVINFLIIAAALFVVIRTFEVLQARRRGRGVVEQETLSDEALLLVEIRDLLRTRNGEL